MSVGGDDLCHGNSSGGWYEWGWTALLIYKWTFKVCFYVLLLLYPLIGGDSGGWRMLLFDDAYKATRPLSLSLIGAIGGYTVFCWFVKRLLNDELVSYKNHFSVSNVLEAMGNNADCGGKASVLSHFLCPPSMFLGSFWNSL